MTGKINIASSPLLRTSDIKRVSKLRDITINQLIVSSLSTSMHEYFQADDSSSEI